MSKLSHVGRRIPRRLLAGTALAGVAAGALIATPAFAQNECGTTTNGTVTCNASGNPYPNGITYTTPAVDPTQDPGLDPTVAVQDLTVNLGDGVAIASGIRPGVAIIGFNDGAATLNAFGNTTIAVSGTGAIGVLGNTNYGDLTINTDSITAAGRASSGINAVSNSGDVTINATSIATTGNSSVGISASSYTGNIGITAGSVTAAGYYVGGINAYAGNGDVTIDAGTVATTGGSFYTYGSDAINVTAGAGSVTINAGTVSTQADYSDGIQAVSFGPDAAVDITAGSITTNGIGANGAIVQGSTANLTVGDITTNGDGATGAVMFGTGPGGATFVSTGTVSTAGAASDAVFVKAYGGDAAVTVNNVATLGDQSRGIYAYGDNVTVTATGNVSTAGDASRAISVFTPGNATITNNGTITTAGVGSSGIAATAIYGDVVVNGAGTVATSGDSARGITGLALYGNVDIAAGNVTTTGDSATAISANSIYGNASVTSTGLVSTSGTYSTGIYAGSSQALGDATVAVNDVTTTGDGSTAIVAYGYNASVTVNGDVSTAGTNALGIVAIGQNGTAAVANNGTIATTGADSAGIYATAYGDVTISGTGSVSSTATGIDAYSLTGNIAVTQGSITTSQDAADGIHAETANLFGTGGNIAINAGSITTTGASADGIDTVALNGGNIAVTHGAIKTSGDGAFGVSAIALDNIKITGTSIATSGYEAPGVYAVSIYGDVAVNAGTVSTLGSYSPGIVGASYFGNVSITADNVATAGYASNGVLGAALNAGNVDIAVGNVTTTGDASIGVAAQAYGDAAVAVTGTVRTSGYGATGIDVYAGGNATVRNTGAIVTNGIEANGIDVQSVFGDVAVSGAGSVTTNGAFSTGIRARSYYGAIAIATGAVTTTGEGSSGIDAYATGGVTVNAGTVRSTGIGISAGASYSVAVTAGSVATTGEGAHGISAASFGGDVTVRAGDVRVAGPGAIAIRAFGFGGGADVGVTGTVTSATDTAISIIAGGAGGGGNIALGSPALDGLARLNVGSAGVVRGATNAVTVSSTNGSSITNGGAIIGGTGYAIEASGGATTITNTGSLTGRLLLTGNADRLTNSGTFTLVGNSDFGAGTDGLTNTGTVTLGASGAVRTAAINNLETFANSGLIELRNGVAGDTLTLPGTAYTGSGTATLGLDVTFNATGATVDRLNVGTASGSTAIVLQTSNTPAILLPGTTVVQASATSSGTAFMLSEGSRNRGLISFGLAYNPTSFAYQLVGAPSATVYRQAKLGEGLASVWNRSGDAITAHLAAGRDGRWGSPANDTSGRVWLQMFGEVNTRDDSRTVTYSGLTQNNVDLGYRQDAFGGQVGIDLVGDATQKSGFTLGVAGGYLSSTMNFRGYGDRFDIDAVNGTVYGGFQAGGFFVNGIAKYDYAWVNSRGTGAGFTLDTKAKTYGGKLEAGFRVGSDAFFFEPAVSAAYTKTDIDGYGVLGGQFDFEDYKGLRGKAGARIGGSSKIGETSTLVFYAGGAAVHEFEGKDGLRFTSGGQTVGIVNDRLGTYAQGILGLNIVTTGGVTGFIEGHGEYNKDYNGGGGRAGIRIKF
ncbi:beta strand repeat-containing protein [Sphingomonas faeni]|uniref:beta strand repeat-containing protein n=1 Tax=Sphingomonas faeni TaxID=185950 RepID=UPI002413C8D3|nr:autotransporter [Sphingomonas faeni]